jgi:hypothetical protein
VKNINERYEAKKMVKPEETHPTRKDSHNPLKYILVYEIFNKIESIFLKVGFAHLIFLIEYSSRSSKEKDSRCKNFRQCVEFIFRITYPEIGESES